VVLGALFALCQLVVTTTGLPVPPGLLALVLLIVLLLARVVPEGMVSSGADALLRILPLLFVAPGVGVIRELHLVSGHGLGLAVVLVASILIGQLVAGVVAEAVVRRERR
jgi:holin-like protein